MTITAPTQARDLEEWRYVPSEFWSGISSHTQSLNGAVTCEGLTEIVTISSAADWRLPDWAQQSLASVLPATGILAAATEWIDIDARDQSGCLTISVASTDAVQVPVWVSTSSTTNVTIGVCLLGVGAANLVVFSDLAPSASLTISVVDDSGSPTATGLIVRQHAESQLHVRSVDAGSINRVRSFHIRQVGLAAVSSIKALNLGVASSQAFFHTVLNHEVEGGQSTQLVKSILTDRAMSEFSGAVHVAKGAQKTDSSQSNPNLVLSDTARAISRPQLHIYADDVKCAHGATMSQIDDDQIYYLQSRGISRAAAQSILMVGFADDVLDDLRHEAVSTVARSMAKRFFDHVNRV